MNNSIPLIFRLRKSCQTTEYKKNVRDVIEGLGLTVKSVNRSSITCTTTINHFIKHFGGESVHHYLLSQGGVDVSTPAGFLHEKHLDVPEDLVECVESVWFQSSSLRY